MTSYFRFLKRNPYYTAINILGLSVALMFVITIGDYTWRHLTVDSQHPHADRIFLIGDKDHFTSWPSEARQAAETIPDIEECCNVFGTGGKIRSSEDYSLDLEAETSILLADSNFFSLFNYPFIEGSPANALSTPDKCVITKSAADALFPDVNPIGRTLTITGGRYIRINDGTDTSDPYDSSLEYTVSAVIKDLDRTVLPGTIKLIANMERAPQILGYRMSGSFRVITQHGCFKTFFQLREGSDLAAVEHALSDYYANNVQALRFSKDKSMSLTPLRDVMFAPQNQDPGLEKGNKDLLIILLCAIIAILVFAVTNYINLTIANTGMRAKEIATRRLLGSSNRSASVKFILESMLMVLVAFLIGLLLAFLLQDKLSALFRGQILIHRDINAGSIAVCAAFVLITGFLSGIIPGIQISSVKPVDVVKGSFRYRSKMIFSRIFIMVQNVATVVMLTLALVMSLQIKGMVTAPLGINTKNLVVVFPYYGMDEEARDVLERLTCIEKIGSGSGTCLVGNFMTASQTGEDINGNHRAFSIADMDQDAFEIYGLEVIHRNSIGEKASFFTEKFMSDMDLSIDATEVQWKDDRNEMIAGVLKDFRISSILDDPLPLRVSIKDRSKLAYPYFIIRTDGSKDAFSRIHNAFKEEFPDDIKDFMVEDVNEALVSQYEEQINTMNIIYMFTGIAILLSVFGLIGLSLFFIRQRRSEIATRRVFGGSINEVVVFMLRKFCQPLLISCAAAIPLAFYIADRWLQDFSWRISLSPWIFIAACIISLVFAVLSILWQTVSAVRRNPADSIKTE